MDDGSKRERARRCVTVFRCNSRLSKKKAALRYFPSLDNIGNTIFTETHSFVASLSSRRGKVNKVNRIINRRVIHVHEHKYIQ